MANPQDESGIGALADAPALSAQAIGNIHVGKKTSFFRRLLCAPVNERLISTEFA